MPVFNGELSKKNVFFGSFLCSVCHCLIHDGSVALSVVFVVVVVVVVFVVNVE